jgi:RHS repeat-associated protein
MSDWDRRDRAAKPAAEPGTRAEAASSQEHLGRWGVATPTDSPVGPDGSQNVGEFRLPSVELPKGGGAIRAIDEKLTVGLATGAASLAVPVATSEGRQGFSPKLSLTYDSGAGNGPFGLGWSLSVPSISRKTAKGLPSYRDADNSDVFVLSGQEDLIPALVPSAGSWVPDALTITEGQESFAVRRYRPRVEAGFARIEQWRDTSTGDVHWRTVSKENVTSLYGLDPANRVADPANPSQIFSWLLELSFDDRGNAISYQYKAEDDSNVPAAAHELGRQVGANRYLKRIFYGNETPYLPAVSTELPGQWCFQVVFDFGEHDEADPQPTEAASWPCRPDPFSTYRPGFEVRTYRTCRRILMFHQFPAELNPAAVLVSSADVGYSVDTGLADPQLPVYSLLTSVTRTGYVSEAGLSGYQTGKMPPLDMGYAPLTISDVQHAADPESLENLTGDLGGGRRRWVDLEGEGLQGILSEDDSAWYYKHNVSAWNPDNGPATARFGPLQLVGTKPSGKVLGAPLQLTDLNGSGRMCAVAFAPPAAGYFERDRAGGWTPFKLLNAAASVDWASPNLTMVDLDGDGLADVLITEDEAITWYRWEAGHGFGPPQMMRKPVDEDHGPALVLADGTNSIHLADMSGDGLADLVRIRNGEVCYWPNMGYGRFGPKITMDGAPVFDYPDRFSQQRIRLADIDGSGPADLIYLGSDAVTIWFNQSGNSWTQGTELTEFPFADDLANVSAFDLLGSGTACLVWTSPLPAETALPLRYIDLSGGIKPYLLTSVANNMGAATSLTYGPSTKFYLQDRAAGNPWVTRLPVPVHVVEQVETTEGVSRTRLVSLYSYHHGYYDGIEREFRGFARVDQLDTDAVPAASGTGQFTSTPPAEGDDFTLAPVWIRTWYHTGAYFDGADIAAGLAAEYYQLDSQAPKLAATVLPEGATAEEEREACRALRGRTLRREVYALDGSPAAVHPYTTSERRYQVQMLQPRSDRSFAGFQAWELEALTCHYERDPADPRIGHELTLEVDGYGNVTKAAAVGYPRRVPEFAEQSITLVSYTEHDVINVPDQADWYRIGLPAESRTYELTGVAPSAGSARYDPVAMLTAAAGAADIPYEATPSQASPQRRLIGRKRTIYSADNLSGPLAVGQADSLALMYASYRMVHTPGLLADIYSTKISVADLTALLVTQGYVDLDGDGYLWSPSARPFYSADPAVPDPAFARQHFYLPLGATDPWGNNAYVSYDSHDLLVAQTTDAAQNITQAASNYRLLRPWMVTDPNLNRSGVRYDPLGMVVATALMGKLQPDGTDEGDHLDISTDEPAAGDDPTTTLDYALSAYQAWAADPAHDPDHPAPVWVHTRARVRHKDPTTPWLETYAYSDGLGRVALAKAQAEAGPAPERGADGRLVIGPGGDLVFQPTATRWVGSGRVIYDNKGNPVKAYEPFFDSSSAYDDETDLVNWGVTAITRYDPLGRAVRVDNPNGTFRTVDFDPWRRITSDENDTVLASDWYQARQAGQLGTAEADAAAKAATDAGTPSLFDLDTLGRAFRNVADNGAAGQYQTLHSLDIQGNVHAVTDALGRQILTQDYSTTGTELHRLSVDAGERWLATDSAGHPLQAWDGRGVQSSHDYDTLRRPTSVHVTEGGNPGRVAEQISYGEGLADAQARNLRGAAYQHQDEAGTATTIQRDFKGNILSASRQMLQNFSTDIDWAQAPAMDAETFTTATTYDALNRPVTVATPDASVTNPVFNERSLLAQVTVNVGGAAAATSVVNSVSYDPKGQRQLIAYGNGAVTRYAYDPDTFRLIRLQTTRPAAGSPLQDLTYTYDPVGNVTNITDAAQQNVYFANQVVTASAGYTYDAVYRLTIATGRELIGLASQPQTDWDDSVRVGVPLPTDGQAMRNYTETYAYDQIGNITSVVHSAANGNWTRTYAYDQPASPPANNQLTSTTVGSTISSYSYDPNGNTITMPQLGLMSWDWKNQLQATALQAPAGGASLTTFYRYDASGERIRKVTASPAGALVRQRSYLGGYEVYREYSPAGAISLERQSLHVSDGAKLVCLIETTTIDTTRAPGATPNSVSRYQFGNHLGSAALELDPAAAIISYEEYYPYGSTSLQSGPSAAEVSLKRYRYTGKERDEETGFYYHGARYYAPWIGRWISCDPSGITDGTCVYAYLRGRVINSIDPNGRQSVFTSVLPVSGKAQPKTPADRIAVAEAAGRSAGRQYGEELAQADFVMKRLDMAGLSSRVAKGEAGPALDDVRHLLSTVKAHLDRAGQFPRFSDPAMQTAAISAFQSTTGQSRELAGLEISARDVVLQQAAFLLATVTETAVVKGAQWAAKALRPASQGMPRGLGQVSESSKVASAADVPAPEPPPAPSIWGRGSVIQGRGAEEALRDVLPGEKFYGAFPNFDRAVYAEAGASAPAVEIGQLKSVDTTLKTYQGRGFYRQIVKAAGELAGPGESSWSYGGQEVTIGSGTQRVLDLALPETPLTQAQEEMLKEATVDVASIGVHIGVYHVR